MNGLLQELKFFFRQTLRRPVWTLSIIGVLALGISANTAMYAGFDAWVTRPLPFESPDELVLVQESRPKLGVYYNDVSEAALGDLSREVGTIDRLEAWDNRYFNVADRAEPARILGASVTHGLFPMLGVEPVVGRQFAPEDDLPSQAAPVRHTNRCERVGHGFDSAMIADTKSSAVDALAGTPGVRSITIR